MFKVSVYIPQWVIQVILNVESESSDGENTDESRNMGSIKESLRFMHSSAKFPLEI